MASPVNDYSGSPRPIYEYHDLPAESIRLLHLEPGSFDDDIAIWLEPVPFQLEEEFDDGDSPSNQQPEPSQSRGSPIEYEALSYVWGPKEKPMMISIEDKVGCIAHVTQNLYIALKHLRYRDRGRVLWIDALCIDQANKKEKNAQVAIMADIYQCADRVVAWLGPEADDSNLAMLSMHYLGSQIVVNWPENGDLSRPFAINAARGFSGFDWLLHSDVPVPLQPGELDAVFHLLSRPWFGRLWIRQEIFLAKRGAVITCGMHQILWVHFRQAMVALYSRMTECKVELTFLMKRLSGFITTQLGSGYRWSRRTFGAATCADPRDRIYGTLRLLYKERNILGITPDYNKSLGEVYADATWRIIQHEQNLTVLEQCELSRTLPGPSWAPDWSSPLKSKTFYHTGASSRLWIELPKPNGRVLRAVGKLVTTIDHLETIEYVESAPKSELIDAIKKIVRTILDRTALSRDRVLESCTTMLLGMHNPDVYEPQPHYPSSRDSKSVITQALAGNSLQEIEDRLRDGESGDWKIGFILEVVTMAIAGRQLYIGSNYSFGMAPILAQPGDHIYVLVGCEIPIVLRPVEGGQHVVVGACYADGIMHGQALLGPLPEKISPVVENNKYAFKDIVSGEVAREDPRLVYLGVDLEGFRKELEHDPEHRVNLKVDVNVLRRAGVTDLQRIELV